MAVNRVNSQKRAQRESLIRKELSTLFLEIKLTDRNLDDMYINNVQLSSDKGSAYVLFFSEKGEDYFNEKLPFIILYKPSVRKALSQILDSRYTPQIIFRYDKTMEKQSKIVALLDKVKSQDSEQDNNSGENICENTCDNTCYQNICEQNTCAENTCQENSDGYERVFKTCEESEIK